MSSFPTSQSQQPPPRQPLNIQRGPSTRRIQDATNPPRPPSRSSSFAFSNRTSFSSIDSALHTTPRRSSSNKSKSRSRSRSNSSGGGGTHNPVSTTMTTVTTTTVIHEQEQQSFTCTFCWRSYPSSQRHIFHSTATTTSTSSRSKKKTPTPRPACPPCYRAIIDLSIYWVCGEVVVHGEECVSLGWCFWHTACYGCLLCGSKRVVRPRVDVGEVFGEVQTGTGDEIVEKGEEGMERDRERQRETERKMLGRKRGREIDQVPLCKACLVEVEGKEGLEDGNKDGEKRDLEKVLVRQGLERIDKVDGGLTRQRWEMREGEKEKEKEREKEKELIGDGGKGGLLPLRRGAVDERFKTRDEMASSSGSDEPETIYVNIFDPVGRESFRPTLMKSIPEWMRSGAREHLEPKTESALAVNSSYDEPREQTTDHTSTISTPRPISQGLSETSSTATVIQTPPQPTASRAASTRRRSSAISPRATSPVPPIDAISRPSSVLGRRTPNLRTGTSFVSEQPLVVPSMSFNHSKETTAKVSAKDPTRDSWLPTDSDVSSSPLTVTQPQLSSRPSSVRSVATIFERGIASKDQRHTPVNQPLPLLRVLQQPYRPLTPIRSDTSLSSSSPHLQPISPTIRPQRVQTHELRATNLPKPIQILRSGQAGQSSMNRMGSAAVSIPVVSTSSEYLERYQPVKPSTSTNPSSFLSSSPSTSVRTSIRAGGLGLGVSAITRGWEGQLKDTSSNLSSSGETERESGNRFSTYSTSQPPSSFLQSSYQSVPGERTSIRRSVSHSIRREGALDEGVRVSQVPQAESYPNNQGQTTIGRSISHSVHREGAHDHGQGQSHHLISQPQSPKPQSPTLPYSPPVSPPNGPNGPHGLHGPTAPIPLNFTVNRRFVKRPSIKGDPALGSITTAGSTTEGNTPSTTRSSTWAALSAESSPGTGEEKGGSGFRAKFVVRSLSASGNPVVDGNSTSGSGTSVMPAPVKTISKRRSGHAELKRLFGRQ